MASPGEKSSRKFQAPKGTRDFYPQDMAVRRYIEGVWRQTSINHGFDEIEGPMFEDIDLYTHKSGPGIVSEIFQVFSGKDEKELAAIRAGGGAPFALRPEFTPTLARMVAAKAAELPRPIKWFAIPQHFRAERPQRGRLREFVQWNVDFIGDDSPKADAEVMAVASDALGKLGLEPSDARIRISDRHLIREAFEADDHTCSLEQALELLDKRYSMEHDLAERRAKEMGFRLGEFDVRLASISEAAIRVDSKQLRHSSGAAHRLLEVMAEVEHLHIRDRCYPDPKIVRGLAYYTGTVFEIIRDDERAIAGGGRYDNLIESFGGPSLPACGFGMGDVVLANILHDKGLLPEEVYLKPLRPHAFAIAASDEVEARMRQTVAQLRRDGFHIRHSYKTTRNVGKLLGEASKSRAIAAIIFGKELADNRVEFKDLQSGEQMPIAISELKERLKQLIASHA
jgi:histidyl-tRNA synthetase